MGNSTAGRLWVGGTVLTVAMFVVAQSRGREFGIDVSHFQGSTGLSPSTWSQMKVQGKNFAYIKASEGLTGPDDAAMANNVARASAAGILTGVYHYPHAENRPTVAGAILEADHFVDYSGDALGSGHLRPVLDLEGNNATLTTAALTDWVLAFAGEVVARRGAAAEPIIYASRSFARDEVDSRVAGLDLWLSYWNAGVDVNVADPPPVTAWPNPTGNFDNWVLWQYSSTGSAGGISPLDLDVVHSEYMPLTALVIPEPSGIAVIACALLTLARSRKRRGGLRGSSRGDSRASFKSFNTQP
jgi:GH25 family lysozyme M1 (1,4-beta-N-acetylmuramidase)